jgi:hypothetical protein
MHELDRSTLLTALDEWGTYADKFKSLPPDRQAAFLEAQGFSAFQDLLGHIIGWWDEGLRILDGVRLDPTFVYHEPDTDAFNAELVRKYHVWNEADVLGHFETARRALARQVQDLTEERLAQPLIREWLYADVVEHLDEHRLPD